MGYWIEVHCDVRSERLPPGDNSGEPPCWSQNDRQPGAMSSASDRGAREAERLARERGWKRKWIDRGDTRRLGWICPHCQVYPA